jgi:hypothetical protein
MNKILRDPTMIGYFTGIFLISSFWTSLATIVYIWNETFSLRVGLIWGLIVAILHGIISPIIFYYKDWNRAWPDEINYRILSQKQGRRNSQILIVTGLGLILKIVRTLIL